MDSSAPTTPAGLVRLGQVPALDGLRGLLVIAIVTYHLGYGSSLFVSVDGFFVLSGFLITRRIVTRPPASGAELRNWWSARLRRLMPAALVMLSVVLIVFRHTDGIRRAAFATVTWWANWNQAFSTSSYWDPSPSPLRHAWTLSIEEQFYMVWPLAVAGLWMATRRQSRRLAWSIIALCTAGAALCYLRAWTLADGGDLNRVYLGTDTRGGAIMIGCCLAAVTALRPPTKRIASLLAWPAWVVVIALAATAEMTNVATYQGLLLVAGLAFAAVVAALSVGAGGAAVLSNPVITWIGVRCYGIYLWSWPIQLWLDQNRPTMGEPLRVGLTAALSLAAGGLSYRWIETPFRDGISWGRSPRIRHAWMSTVAVAAAATALLAPVTPDAETREVSIEESAAIALEAVMGMDSSTTTDPAMTEPPDTSQAPSPSITDDAPTGATTPPPADPEVLGEVLNAPPPPSTTPSVPPIPQLRLRVVTAGDSQAFKAAHPAVTRRQLPSYIESVTVAGVLGCGILVRAPGWTMFDPDRGGFVDVTYCHDTAEVAEAKAVASGADWMVLFSGAFERPFQYRGPDGTMHERRDPAIRAAVVEQLTARIDRAAAHGVRTALVEWSCAPGEANDPDAVEGTRWYNDLIREVAASRPGTITIPPNERVCVNADPTGVPTEEKNRAWGYEVHPADREWLWKVQIGPALWAASLAG